MYISEAVTNGSHCLCHSEFRIESMEESNIRGTENWTWTNRYYTLKAKAGSFKFYVSRHILYNPPPYNLKKIFSLGFYIYSVRDHPHVTSVKDWVGRSRKWPVLLTFSFVFNTSKGQLISKADWSTIDSLKKRTNQILPFVFWENLRRIMCQIDKFCSKNPWWF